jgi:hypothetical protein
LQRGFCAKRRENQNIPPGPQWHRRTDIRLMQDRRQVESLRLVVIDRRGHLQPFTVADHLVEGPIAQPGHPLADLLGDEAHEVDHFSVV